MVIINKFCFYLHLFYFKCLPFFFFCGSKFLSGVILLLPKKNFLILLVVQVFWKYILCFCLSEKVFVLDFWQIFLLVIEFQFFFLFAL